MAHSIKSGASVILTDVVGLTNKITKVKDKKLKNQITGKYYLLMNYSFKFDVHKKAPMRVCVWKK